MEDRYQKLFKHERKLYQKIRLRHIKAQRLYEEELYGNNNSKRLASLKMDLDEAKQREEQFINEYAYKIFTELSKTKPNLIRRINNSIVPWMGAFGVVFDDISPALRGSLVALIEMDGGQYRIAE